MASKTIAAKTTTSRSAKKGLVIVESPTKARTLQRYLGKDFDIRASVGHIKDLPPKRLGVDIVHAFAPEYAVIKGKNKVLKDLRTAAAKVEDIYLAPDPDREGEAIAWHIAEELQSNKVPQRFHRVLFYELTERAIKEAIRSPGVLDRSRYESQQARRILDRLVGYEISPLLWDKVRRGLSAGRVQSVAVRIICDREREIQAFVSQEYWTVMARLEGVKPPPFDAKVVAFRAKKLTIPNEETAGEVVGGLENAVFRVAKVETKERKRQAAPPFITSTLQQEAARKLRFSARKTMMLAQRLYEGVELGPEGPIGLITYMRTDSTRVAKEAVQEARAYIEGNFGKEYVPARIPTFKQGKLAQGAHEAIRPTAVGRAPKKVARYLDREARALYELIWKRLVASQMSPALFDQTSVDIEAGEYRLRVTGTVVKFEGFMVVYTETADEPGNGADGTNGAGQVVLPPVSRGDVLNLLALTPKQHFTQPPPRYTEASLIKALEEQGVGRPSTYAAILSTIRDKEYVRLDQRRFVPTELGLLVTDLLVAHFPEIMDVGFTAEMEKDLDRIEEGLASWVEILGRFYGPFSQRLGQARQEMRSVKSKGVSTDILCEKCGAPMVIKYGRSGEFLGCSAYPECRHTSDFTRDTRGRIQIQRAGEQVVGTCDKCGRPMVVKKGRFGGFLACTGYPECRNTRPISTGVPCPELGCDGELVQRRSKSGRTFYGCSRYPVCRYATWDQPVAKACPQCGSKILLISSTQHDGIRLLCPAKGCSYKASVEEV